MAPPRLWPMIATFWPCVSAIVSMRSSSRSTVSAEQSMFDRKPALRVLWPVRLSQRVMNASVSSPARKPGIRSTGWPAASGTPSPL